MAFFKTVAESELSVPAKLYYDAGIYRGVVPFGQIVWTDDRHLASIGDPTKWIPLGDGAIRGDYAAHGLFHMIDIRVISEIRLRIRYPGNATGEVQGYIPPGTVLKVVDTPEIREAIGDKNAWVGPIGYEGAEGFVNGAYVELVRLPEPTGDSVTMEFHLDVVAGYQAEIEEYEAELEKHKVMDAERIRLRELVTGLWNMLAEGGAGPE